MTYIPHQYKSVYTDNQLTQYISEYIILISLNSAVNRCYQFILNFYRYQYNTFVLFISIYSWGPIDSYFSFKSCVGNIKTVSTPGKSRQKIDIFEPRNYSDLRCIQFVQIFFVAFVCLVFQKMKIWTLSPSIFLD